MNQLQRFIAYMDRVFGAQQNWVQCQECGYWRHKKNACRCGKS